jgi:uncharacterized membrane protein YbhN (UPF0104 family)
MGLGDAERLVAAAFEVESTIMSEEIHQEQEIIETSERCLGSGGKKTNRLWNLIKIIVAIILVAVVFSQTDIQQLVALKGRLSVGWLFGYFALFCLLLLVKVFQYWALFDGRVAYRSMLRIVVWQNSLANLIATGAGIASYLAMLRTEEGMKISSSGAVFILTKVGEVLMIGVYLAVSAGLLWTQIQSVQILVLLLLVGILAGFIIFILAVIQRERFLILLQRITALLCLDRFSVVNRILTSLDSVVKTDQKEIFRLLGIGVGISFFYISFTNIMGLVSLKIFGFDVGIWPIVFVASFLQLFANVPIQVLGGLGVTEVTSVFLFSLFGIDTAEMAAIQLGMRAIFYLSNATLLLYLPLEQAIARKKNQ